MPHALGRDRIVPGQRLPHHLYQEGGERLLRAGERVTPSFVQALDRAGIRSLTAVHPGEEEHYLKQQKYRELPIDHPSLQKEGRIRHPLYDSRGRLLLPAGGTWTMDLRNRLMAQGHLRFLLDRPRNPDAVRSALTFRQHLQTIEKDTPPRPPPPPPPGEPSGLRTDLPADRFVVDPRRHFTEETIDRTLAVSIPEILADPEGKALAASRIVRAADDIRDGVAKDRMRELRRFLLGEAKDLFESIGARRRFDGERIGRAGERLIRGMLADKDMLLATVPYDPALPMLPQHAINVAILSINIATALGQTDRQVYELAFGALLHDVGMLRVPEAIWGKPETLSADERWELERHPTHGLDILQTLERIPLSTGLVVYQEQERLDGSGYPRRRSGRTIHPYSRIVAVADIYEAISSPRPHRPARHPYRAMEELIREKLANHIDREPIQALLRYIGLYPVGSWVKLDTGEVGRVIGAHEDRYDRPIVSILPDGNGPLRRLDLDRAHERKVVDVVDIDLPDDDPLIGF